MSESQSQSQNMQRCRLLACGFPCTGKSSFQMAWKQDPDYFFERWNITEVIDLDSAPYDLKQNGQAGEKRYLADIMEATSRPGAIVLVSCHKEMRRRISSIGLQYVRAYPDPGLKDVWLARQEERSGRDGLWRKMNNEWDHMMEIDNNFDSETSGYIVFGEDEYLTTDKLLIRALGQGNQASLS